MTITREELEAASRAVAIDMVRESEEMTWSVWCTPPTTVGCPGWAKLQVSGSARWVGTRREAEATRVQLAAEYLDCKYELRRDNNAPPEAKPERVRERTAGYNTLVTVHATDSTDRDIPICFGDTASHIGEQVIRCIHGERQYQYSTRVAPGPALGPARRPRQLASVMPERVLLPGERAFTEAELARALFEAMPGLFDEASTRAETFARYQEAKRTGKPTALGQERQRVLDVMWSKTKPEERAKAEAVARAVFAMGETKEKRLC